LGAKSTAPDCTLAMNDDICADIMSGKLNPQNAFFAQKLKMKGSLPLGIKLQNLRKYQKPVLTSKL
jgi:putative sterol carrier protein